MRRRIKLKNIRDAIKLATEFDTKRRITLDALLGSDETELINNIRYRALYRYGGIYVKRKSDKDVVTVRKDSNITHYFYGKTEANGRVVEKSIHIDTNTGCITCLTDGKFKMRVGKAPISSLNTLIKNTCKGLNLDYDKYFKI